MTNLFPRLEFMAQALVRRRRDCPQCHREQTDVVARKHWLVRVRKCPECALFFTDPSYDQSAFGSLYDNIYGAEGSTTEMPDAVRLSELMRTSFRGTDKDCHARLAILERLAPGKRLLEIGSSWGYFLRQASDHGFDATGVEVSGPRREFGRSELGQRIVPTMDELESESFDLVYSAHTLEHFTELRGVLAHLRDLLAPGGLLAIEVPHFDLEGRGREALSIVGAVHPLGFTGEFFQRNLAREGFREIRLFDRWDDVPHRCVQRTSGDDVIALARKPERGGSEEPDG